MCELLAISSRELVAADFALERFARRGGLDGPHRDGWGIAAYEGPDVFRLREPLAAAESELVRYVDRHIPPSRLIITHIRLATRGDRALWNTQPFQRELGGRVHLFAHNGNLSGVDREAFRSRRFRPLGDTDSELVFCHLLERLAPLWDATDTVPPLADRLARVAEVAAELRPHGPANFFYADSDALFVHAHRRTQADGEIRPPGLHMLDRRHCDLSGALADSGLDLHGSCQDLLLFASTPLTDGPWQPLPEGAVLAVADGEIVARTG